MRDSGDDMDDTQDSFASSSISLHPPRGMHMQASRYSSSGIDAWGLKR